MRGISDGGDFNDVPRCLSSPTPTHFSRISDGSPYPGIVVGGGVVTARHYQFRVALAYRRRPAPLHHATIYNNLFYKPTD